MASVLTFVNITMMLTFVNMTDVLSFANTGPGRRRAVAVGAAVLAAVATTALAIVSRHSVPAADPMTLDFVPPPGLVLWTSDRRADFALSPDGQSRGAAASSTGTA